MRLTRAEADQRRHRKMNRLLQPARNGVPQVETLDDGLRMQRYQNRLEKMREHRDAEQMRAIQLNEAQYQKQVHTISAADQGVALKQSININPEKAPKADHEEWEEQRVKAKKDQKKRYMDFAEGEAAKKIEVKNNKIKNQRKVTRGPLSLFTAAVFD